VKACVELAEQSQMDMAQVSLCLSVCLSVCLSHVCLSVTCLARLNVHVQQLVGRETDAYQQVKACVELAEQSQMDMAQVSVCLSVRLSVCHMSVCLNVHVQQLVAREADAYQQVKA